LSKRWQRILGGVFLLLLVAGVAFASEAAGGGHGDKVMNLVYRVINFILVLAILYKLVGKKAAEFFTGRTQQIETELNDLETRRRQAEARLKEIESKVASLEQEREAILQSAREQGEAIKAQIIEQAKATAAKIEEQAKVSAEQEAKAAFEQVKAELAEKIVQAAEEMLQQRLDGDIHRKLINEYLTKVVIN